ncbi:Pectate lyase superfamily protein [Stieleria maiorica]|uniref:Pectate lyase superfamily protein n=1 Tax=Stieleria maiorica TaxID=2795974 RepID=A0A5B9MGK8_9BACT|nr:right-handed parallel beta-helix repeat-containing protein [Stieleria maiorica]QEG00309.1 Pectate lyase superfamily protein [Stieleria maiorica]
MLTARFGSIILAVSLATLTVHADVPKGLVGDGVADDTAAIQAAVDAKTGLIEFGRGVYRLTKPITIDLDRVGWTSLRGDGVAQFKMEAAGPAFRFIGTHDGTASPRTVKPNVWDRQRTPMVDGIEILGGHPDACGIEANGTMQLTLTRVVVRKAKHAIHLIGRNRNVTLSECHLYENNGIGVYLDRLNLHQINIANCHISYNAGGGIVSRGSEIRNLQIGTCDIEGNMGDASSQPTANVLLDSTDTSVGEVAIVGCTIQHTHDAPGSANIRINGWSDRRPFTDERRTGNITIADNVLSDVQTNLDITAVRGITISGNTMWKGYAANAIMRDCKQVVMTGNLYDRNPRYHYGDGGKAKLGVIIEDCRDVTINGDHYGGEVIEHPAALQLRRCDGVNIHGCSFSAVSQAGIRVDGVQFGLIANCLFTAITGDAVDVQQAGGSDVDAISNRFRRLD